MKPSKKIIFFTNHVDFFVSHRLPIAVKLIQEGHKVTLISGQSGSYEVEQIALQKLSNYPIKHIKLIFKPSSINPLIEIFSTFQLIYYLFKLKPDILHCVSPKGVLYGGIAGFISRTKGIVLAISGMGYLFTNSKKRSSFSKIILKQSYLFIFKMILLNNRHIKVIVQNKDDLAWLSEFKTLPNKCIHIIKGSGVNLNIYKDVKLDAKQKTILLVGRMLKEKGVYEFIEAAQNFKSTHPEWSFVLIGAADYDNPSSISSEELYEMDSLGIIKWLGHLEDASSHIKKSSIMCLPSYREGMPKVLLEGAAAGCAIITTDVPGCRDAIEDNLTGVLVPLHDQDKLNEAIQKFISSDELRKNFGERAIKHAALNYGIDAVVDKHLEIYNSLFVDT